MFTVSVIRIERLAGGMVVARVDGAPELEAVGSSAERVLARIGRELDRARRAQPREHRTGGSADLPVLPARPPAPPPTGGRGPLDEAGRFRCSVLALDLALPECAERWTSANAPAPVRGGGAELGRWVLAKVEHSRCAGCPIGAAHAAQECAA